MLKETKVEVIVEKDGQRIKRHPSFGSIVFSRVQGERVLAGSAASTGHYVTLEIKEAEIIEHGFGHETVFPRKTIVEVAMTNAQFAELISRWNVGDGTPCTITDRPDPEAKFGPVPSPTPDDTAREKFDGVIADAVGGVNDLLNRSIKEILELVGDRLPKKQKERLDMVLRTLSGNAPANLEYAAECLNEVAEKITARAKVEIEAAGQARLTAMGLQALKTQLGTMTAARELPAVTICEKSIQGFGDGISAPLRRCLLPAGHAGDCDACDDVG